MLHQWKYLEIHDFTDFGISNDRTPTGLVASGHFRDCQEINVLHNSHQHWRQSLSSPTLRNIFQQFCYCLQMSLLFECKRPCWSFTDLMLNSRKHFSCDSGGARFLQSNGLDSTVWCISQTLDIQSGSKYQPISKAAVVPECPQDPKPTEAGRVSQVI